MKLESCEHLLVFGGSFDPPHRGHVLLPEAARRALGCELIAYVPAARPPHKLDREQACGDDRLAMLRLALKDQARTTIVTDELDRADDGRPSYTVYTLRALRERLQAGAMMRLLIGVDQVLIFDQWKDAREIAALAEPAVMLRPPYDRAALLAALPAEARDLWRGRVLAVPRMEISSTEVRRRVRAGEAIDDLVPTEVAAYIRRRGLYRSA